MIEKMPPCDIDAERALLGAVILSGKSVLAGLELTPEDFYQKSHVAIFRAMLSLNRNGGEIDVVTLCDALRKSGELDSIGGVSYLAGLGNGVATSALAKHHAGIIREKAIKRILRQGAMSVLGRLDSPLPELVSSFRSMLSEASSGASGKLHSMGTLTKNIFSAIEERISSRAEFSGVPSGFADLDELTDGFQPGELYILAARPSVGKTAFALQMLLNAARLEFPVGLVSVEMGEKPIGIRLLANLSGIPKWKLQRGLLNKSEQQAMVQASSVMAALPMSFEFNASTLAQVEGSISRMAGKGARLVAVDYLQLLRGNKSETRALEIAEISTALKHAAKAHDIPIVCLSQLNRAVENRTSKRPALADLRDSGQIEQDADAVFFLYQTNQKNTLCLEIAKGRNIGLGQVYLNFDGDLQRFEPLGAEKGESC